MQVGRKESSFAFSVFLACHVPWSSLRQGRISNVKRTCFLTFSCKFCPFGMFSQRSTAGTGAFVDVSGEVHRS
jgi:hypothetical protein